MKPAVLAQSLRPIRAGVLEEVIFYGVEGGLMIYGGLRYPGARSSAVNTGGSRRVEAADFALTALKTHEQEAWAALSEAERDRVLAWVSG